MGSLDIGTAGPVSPKKGATVTEVRSLLHPKINSYYFVVTAACGAT